MAMADLADEGGHCWPSLAYVGESTCFGRAAVIDAIRWLARRAQRQEIMTTRAERVPTIVEPRRQQGRDDGSHTELIIGFTA